MRRMLATVLGLAGFVWATTAPIFGEEPKGAGARINNLKVLSDKIDDVSTVENILKSFIKPKATDAERSKALWTAAVKYRHQCVPPNEFLAADWEAHDPVKIFNVYGYCMCCCASSLIESLNRLDGREARGRILNGHSVPEVKYGGAWHMYDASLITYFPKPANGEVASVDEIAEAVAAWHAKNPGYKGNGAKLDEIMRSDGWTGFKKGPELLANCPFYKLGWLPSRTHGWNATMAEYDFKSTVYEYGYHVGYRALFSLRPGETFVREAGNRGLHVNMQEDPGFDQLKSKVPNNDLVYVKDFLPGYNGGVVANGYHRYAPDLASGGLALGAEIHENLASGRGSPALHLASGGKTGVAVVPVSSPYIYLGGLLKLKAVRKTEADQVKVSISTDNARTFTPLWSADKTGVVDARIQLKDSILRRYAYWLKIELTSASTDGAGLDLLEIENDIQHAPRTMAWLGKGSNTITVAADSDPTVATRTIACRITAENGFRKNETATGMGVTIDNLDLRHESYWWKGGTGTMTVPFEAPGEIVGLTFSTQIRARGEKDLVQMQLSFDDGQTWLDAAKIAGPTQGRTEYFRFQDVPKGKTKGRMRYVLTGNNTIGVLSFRIDADYKDPRAAKNIPPFTVVYRWKENGQEKTNNTIVNKLPFQYTIDAAADPEMVSITYAMPAK